MNDFRKLLFVVINLEHFIKFWLRRLVRFVVATEKPRREWKECIGELQIFVVAEGNRQKR